MYLLGVDFESFHDIFKHPIRRKIILTLYNRQKLSYMDLMVAVEAANTGKFNYHLKVLADLINKDKNDQYGLTEKGHLAAQFLDTFKEKKEETSRLRMSDALLIGFAGFIVTIINPFFWSFISASLTNINSVPLSFILSISISIFGIVVPGALMWWLAVRKAHSHDPYNLFKAPIVTFAILLPLLIIMLIFNADIRTQIQIQTSPTISSGNITLPSGGMGSWSRSTMIEFPMSLLHVIVLSGLYYSFIGVGIAELVSRIKKASFKRSEAF